MQNPRAHYWIEDDHLLCQPIGPEEEALGPPRGSASPISHTMRRPGGHEEASRPPRGSAQPISHVSRSDRRGATIGSRQVWGVHLGELQRRRSKGGSLQLYPVQNIGVTTRSQTKRTREQRSPQKKKKEKGKEKVEGPAPKRGKREEEEEEGEPHRVVHLPPEVIDYIMLLALPSFREPTIHNRRVLFGELRQGTDVARALGNVDLMKEWWPGGVDLAEVSDAYTPLEFARLWYPLYVDDYNAEQLRVLYGERIAYWHDTEKKRLEMRRAIAAHMRPKPEFDYAVNVAIGYARLKADILQFGQAVADVATSLEEEEEEEEEGKSLAPEQTLKVLLRGTLEDVVVDSMSLRGYSLSSRDHNRRRLEDSIQGSRDYEYYEQEVKESKVAWTKHAAPLVDTSLEAIRFLRNQPRPKPLRILDMAMLFHLLFIVAGKDPSRSKTLGRLSSDEFSTKTIVRMRRNALWAFRHSVLFTPWWPPTELPQWVIAATPEEEAEGGKPSISGYISALPMRG